MENPYIKQFPDVMSGKKILYVHGFASSGQSGTVKRLRTVFPNATVIAPDLPIHPEEAICLLYKTCEEEQPDLIIGTSMGGMYTEQLRGFDRICVNPALCIADTMKEHGMTGTQQFQNPRLDGVQEFYVDKALVKEYREVSERRLTLRPSQDERGERKEELSPEELEDFARKEQGRVYGLFGDKDDLVDTYDMFHAVYPQATHFDGEHRMNDQSFMHSVVPVIRWIDDRQEKRQRPIIYICIEGLSPRPLQKEREQKLLPSALKAIRMLIERYEVFFVGPLEGSGEAQQWLAEHVGVPAWQHTIFTPRLDLLYGDYIIRDERLKMKEEKEGDLMATLISFGSDTFKTWDDIIEYFSRLGGQ